MEYYGVYDGTRVQNGLPQSLGGGVRKELGDIEVCVFIVDMTNRVPVQIHNVNNDVLVEARVLCPEADAEAKWRGLHLFAQTEASDDLLQSFSGLLVVMSRTGFFDRVEQFVEK